MAASGETYLLQMVMQLKDQLSNPMKKIGKELNAFGRSLGDLQKASSELIAPLAAPFTLLAGAGAFSITKAISSYTELADTLDKASIRTGVTAEALQALHFGAVQSGMSADEMDKALIKLSAEMGKAASGQNQNLVAMFKHLGINLHDANGHVRSAADVMNNLAQAIKNNESPAARMQILNAAFGEELGARLIPLLQGGAEGLAEYKKQAEELGLVMSSEEIQKANEFGDRLSLVKMASDSVSVAIGAKLRPVLDELIEPMLQIIVANRDWIATQIGEFVQEFATYLKSIDWKQTIENLKQVLRNFSSFIEFIGGANTVLIFFGTLIGGGIVVKLLSFMKALKDVAVAVKILTLALRANPMILIATVVATIIGYMITWKGLWGDLFNLLFSVGRPIFYVLAGAIKFFAMVAWEVSAPLRAILGLMWDIGKAVGNFLTGGKLGEMAKKAQETAKSVSDAQKQFAPPNPADADAGVPQYSGSAAGTAVTVPNVPNVPASTTAPATVKAQSDINLHITGDKGLKATVLGIETSNPAALTTEISYQGA